MVKVIKFDDVGDSAIDWGNSIAVCQNQRRNFLVFSFLIYSMAVSGSIIDALVRKLSHNWLPFEVTVMASVPTDDAGELNVFAESVIIVFPP